MRFLPPLKRLLLFVVFIAMSLVTSTQAYAQDSNLSAFVNNSNPLKPVLVLTNTSTAACQVVQTALGTISVTKVTQDSKEIKPLPINVAFDESLDVILANKLHTLKPGEKVEIPLRVVPYQAGFAIEAITWSPDAGAFGLLYPLEANKPYTLAVTYSAPITVSSGAPLCGIASGTTTTAPDVLSILKLLGTILVLFALSLLIRWLKQKKWQRPVVATTIVIGLLLAMPGMTKLAQADYDVPDSAQTQFDDCMNTLRAHRDITGPVLDAIDRVHIEIVPTDDGTNDTSAYPDGHFRIYWDPNNIYNYYSDDGGGPIVSDPCTRLYHEMYHVFDMLNGTFSRDYCDGSTLETKEVMATRAQNRLREALGLRPRTHYGRTRLPEGSCTPPPPPPPCRFGCGMSNGDPHLLTFDKLRYDFQAVGEFVLARDKNGDFEVQTRQEPWDSSRFVSINTAVATRVGTDRVELQMRDQKMMLLVNGKKQSLTAIHLKSGGSITPSGINQVIVAWPDGSTVTTNTIGLYGMYTIIDPSPERKGRLEGLLGNYDGQSKNDLIVHGSNTILGVQPTFEQLYPTFADSWRISETTSLFTYDMGKSTKTYTDRTFPDKFVLANDLPNHTAAEALCKGLGITDPAVLENCILDVAITGRPEFARAASNGQLITSTVAVDGKTWKITIGKPGDIANVTFDGKAGDKIFLDVSQSTLPDTCGEPVLRAPSGNNVASGCIINGRGLIDGTILPETGKYSIIINPGGKTGVAYLKLLTITDQHGTITPDGNTVTANIDKPGEVAEFTFAGKAGQHVFVSIPSSTLPDQCGGIGIKGPANEGLSSGCIINGKGFIDTVLLPTTGTYTLFVDPAERNTGQANLRLILAQEVTAALTINGSTTTIKFTKPGAFATLTFAGVAGQRIFVDVSSSTLPDQCGVISLQEPDTSTLAGGCIINHKGGLAAEGIVLPASGIYKLILDPSESTTGQATIQIHS